MVKEQRRHPRFHCNGVAELHFPGSRATISARIEDLSLLGCRLVLVESSTLSPQDRFEIAFVVNQLPFRVSAELRSLRHKDMVLGVEFQNLSHRSRTYLQDLIDELAARRLPPAPRDVSSAGTGTLVSLP